MSQKQYTFSEMTRKIVINVADGRELGHVCDLVFNNCGGIIGFVVPGKKSFFKSITSSDNVFIPWNRIIKIGSDVILTELVGGGASTFAAQPEAPQRSTAEAYAVKDSDGIYSPQSVDNSYTRQPQNPYGRNDNYGGKQDVYVPSEIERSSTAQTVYHSNGKTDY